MDSATLLHVLEQALASGTLSRVQRPFVALCLPALRDNTLDLDDQAALEGIAATLALTVTPPSGTTANNSQFRDHAMLAGRDITVLWSRCRHPPIERSPHNVSQQSVEQAPAAAPA